MTTGKYIRTEEIRKKMSLAHIKNPTKYWLGKRIPVDIVDKIKETKRKNGKVGNSQYFKTHRFIGKNHKLWKGDKVGYYALHSWIIRTMGRPSTCEQCGRKNLSGKFIQWANKSGEYKRIKNDWIRLCAKCHYHYDRD